MTLDVLNANVDTTLQIKEHANRWLRVAYAIPKVNVLTVFPITS